MLRWVTQKLGKISESIFWWELDLDGMGMSACSCSCGMTSPRYQRWQRQRSHRTNNVHQAMLFRLMCEAIFTNCIDNAQCSRAAYPMQIYESSRFDNFLHMRRGGACSSTEALIGEPAVQNSLIDHDVISLLFTGSVSRA